MIARKFAEYIVSVQSSSLPSDVTHHAKRCLIDWFAATLPGGQQAPASLLRKALSEELGQGRCWLLPDARSSLARVSALINGVAAHTVEFDDIYSRALYHPGAPVIAAALTVAQDRDASGQTLLSAIVAGYEVSNRIGAAVNPAHYQYWHTTGTVGVFGAVSAAARVMRLDVSQCVDALGNGATMAAGLQQAFRSDAMSKPLHAGRAAEAGVLTAMGAAHGVTGARDMLEGECGFGAAMSADVQWSEAVATLGRQHLITHTTQKNHGCCGHAFAALDAIIALREQHQLSLTNVARVRIGTYEAALKVTGNSAPRGTAEAKFSLPYCATVALADGKVRLDAFAQERITDPKTLAFCQNVSLHSDEQAQSEFPNRRGAQVEIETTTGNLLTSRVQSRKGDPEAPLSDDELEAKYKELAAPILGTERSDRLLRLLWNIDKESGMQTLREAISEGPHTSAAAS